MSQEVGKSNNTVSLYLSIGLIFGLYRSVQRTWVKKHASDGIAHGIINVFYWPWCLLARTARIIDGNYSDDEDLAY